MRPRNRCRHARISHHLLHDTFGQAVTSCGKGWSGTMAGCQRPLSVVYCPCQERAVAPSAIPSRPETRSLRHAGMTAQSDLAPRAAFLQQQDGAFSSASLRRRDPRVPLASGPESRAPSGRRHSMRLGTKRRAGRPRPGCSEIQEAPTVTPRRYGSTHGGAGPPRWCLRIPRQRTVSACRIRGIRIGQRRG